MKLEAVRYDRGVDWYEEGHTEQSRVMALVTYGRCVYWVEGEKYILEKGDLLLIPPGTAYYAKSVPTVMHTKYVVRFAWLTDAGELSVLTGPQPLHHSPGCYELVIERLKEMTEQWGERADYYKLMAGAQLTEALVYLSRETDRGQLPVGKRRLAESMKQYIQTNYRQAVNKEALGEAVGLSPNYAATLFRTVTGQTISEYMHRQRIKTAIYMLTDSLLTIHEIAESVGYSDPSYFHRVFKRLTGSTPSAYLQDRPPTP
ncbi:AraC family transcriptional regulator [Paenibacillus sp. 598K]|uniref:AraC family transcriptional regulator n=1 Tax=Paenibacillus sp. 598K TaxID=1117987 RepID=UPI000FF9D26D|nr:AraC family transcriptional regulator [Paenibacillus sp. 598K]GBF78007.1 AraC family transcriptional regulator [Paenibacillus sp. 598K]